MRWNASLEGSEWPMRMEPDSFSGIEENVQAGY
jgi:hypothetical protein